MTQTGRESCGTHQDAPRSPGNGDTPATLAGRTRESGVKGGALSVWGQLLRTGNGKPDNQLHE